MRIAASLLEKIQRHATRTYPEECCGVLLGKLDGTERFATDIIEIENARQERKETRFLITPEAYLHADKVARGRGLEILGFYHSHPDHPAQPSQYDKEQAWTWFSYMITQVENGQPRESTSWILREDRSGFDEEPIVTSE